jgi:hypothetical protein
LREGLRGGQTSRYFTKTLEYTIASIILLSNSLLIAANFCYRKIYKQLVFDEKFLLLSYWVILKSGDLKKIDGAFSLQTVVFR